MRTWATTKTLSWATTEATANWSCKAMAAGEPSVRLHPLPDFVELRGGDYFFLPSITALGMIAMGLVDPR